MRKQRNGRSGKECEVASKEKHREDERDENPLATRPDCTGSGHQRTDSTPLERGWKIVSLILSILVMAGGLYAIGTVAGVPVPIFLLLITIAFFVYLAYYKKKHGYPWGSGGRV